MTGIAHLPARLGIERRVVENNFHFASGLHFGYELTLLNQRHNAAVGGSRLCVAIEDRLAIFRQLQKHRQGNFLLSPFPRRPGALALLLHFGFVAIAVNVETIVLDDVLDKIGAQAERYREA